MFAQKAGDIKETRAACAALIYALLLLLIGGCSQRMPEQAGVKNYDSFYIPESTIPQPNYATLEHYLKKVQRDTFGFSRFYAEKSSRPRQLDIEKRKSAFLDEQMEETGLISYLYYDDGAIVYDEVSSKDRFGKYVNDETPLWTHSIGKSWTSYLLGYAICNGYIETIDSKLSDWPLIEGTLYEDQKIIDLINMRAGDQGVVNKKDGFISTGRWFNSHPISSFAARELRETEKGARKFNYNGFVTNVMLNYIFFKLEEDPERFLTRVFGKEIGIAEPLFFLSQQSVPLQYGPVRYSARASRYDFLRVGVAMIEEWQNDSCIGKYLKDMIEIAERQNVDYRRGFRLDKADRYGGFFWTHYDGMRDRNILGMDGYGGQALLIDFDERRVVSANSIHNDYDWTGLVYHGIRDGDIRKE